MQPEPNELRRELLSTLGLNPFKANNSASREQMLANHLGQRLVTEGATERYIQTGMEAEFGKYTFAVRMPHNGHVIKAIDRYTRTYDEDAIKFSPQTVMIYEREDNKEIGYVDLRKFSTQHPYFGFEYSARSGMSKMRREGNPIREGEIFQDSPAVTEYGGYKLGVQLNVAYMTHPAVSEDGILICEDQLDKFAFKTYETRVVEWGSNAFPLNAYGTKPGQYKPFPDLGDELRPDGLLMALRTYDSMLAPVEQSEEDLKEIDFHFDETTYAGAGGRVVDIRVFHQNGNPLPLTPQGMDGQPLKYDRARREFYQEILDVWHRLKRERGPHLKLTPQFHSLVREAISVVGHNTMAPNEVVKLLYRQAPLDEWRIEFVIEYRIVPKDGAKLTDFHGGKGVICQIAKPHEMPVDAHGNRADAIMDPAATWARANYGRFFEHYFNAAGRDLLRELMIKLGVHHQDRHLHKELARIENEQPELMNEVWNTLMDYYSILTPPQHAMFMTGIYSEPRIVHLERMFKQTVPTIYWKPDNQPEPLDCVRQVQAKYPPLYGPVTYVGNSGKRVTTKDPVMIGSVYIMGLEKIADDWSAVSSGKLQHFGVLSQLTASDKFSKPTRNQAIRATGESEVRIYVSYCGTEITADLLDRNNNPFTHKHIVENLLNAEKPTAIHSIVNREEFPLGGSKPLQLVTHTAQAGGWMFEYEEPKPISQS